MTPKAYLLIVLAFIAFYLVIKISSKAIKTVMLFAALLFVYSAFTGQTMGDSLQQIVLFITETIPMKLLNLYDEFC